MESKNIILFIDSLGTGGAQRQIVNLAIGLKIRGFNPLLVCYARQNYFQNVLIKNKIETVCLSRKNILDIFFIYRLYILTKRSKTKWIIAFLFMPSGYALLLKFFLPNLKVIVSERSFEQKTKFREKIFPRFFYGLASYITTNSMTQRNVLSEKMSRHIERIKFIPNGVSDQRWIYNYKNPRVNLVSIGRVSALKETKLLIKSVVKIKERFNQLDIKIFWVGAKYDTNEADSRYYKECLTLIDKYNLNDHWEWTGQISDVKKILNDASLLIHMSTGEGFPNAICEAMSLGIPVIASDVMDHPNIIVNDFNGYLVDTGDLDGLGNALASFFSLSETDRIEMSKRAYNTAIRAFSLDKMIDSYCELINSKN